MKIIKIIINPDNLLSGSVRACLRITSYKRNNVISDKHNMHYRVGFMWWCMLVS